MASVIGDTQAPAQAREGSFWWTAGPMAPPLSACGRGFKSSPASPTSSATRSEGLFPVLMSDADSGASARISDGYAQSIQHGLASKRRRPAQLKTFLDLDAFSTRSNTLSAFSTSTFSPTSRGRTRSLEFDDNAFLFSGSTSTATITIATEPVDTTNVMAASSTDTTARAVGADATTLHHSALREMRDLELMQDTDIGLPDRGRQRERSNNHHLRVFDHFSADQRPSSSRSHLRYWHRSKSPVPDASKYLRVSSDDSSPSINNLPSMTMTRDEFDALPPTIQRKYFSTLERLHIAHNLAHSPEPASTPDAGQDPLPLGLDNANCHRPSVLTTLADPTTTTGASHLRINSIDQHFYANLPDKIKRRHLSKEEQLVAQTRQRRRRRRSLSVGASDNFTAKPKLRHSLRALGASNRSLGSTVSLIEESFDMESRSNMDNSTSVRSDVGGETFFNTFRWLEDEDDLDLRLFLDDYHINLREEVPLPSKSRRPSFRRHLSISKLPFGRTNLSTTRLSISSISGAPTPTTAKPPSLISDGAGHVRRKSRALSLVNGNRQPVPGSPTALDPAASHYQDPNARLRLKEYLGTSTKFDEALEFGFPSMEERRNKPQPHLELSLDLDKPRTFLDDDDDKSSYSEECSVADSESPRTPHAFDKPVTDHAAALTAFPIPDDKSDLLQAPRTSREMTLRMTLTRPDLRANEEQMYGWQKSNMGRPAHSHSASKTPTVLVRDISPKESIEKQFAAFDQENMTAHDNGVVKRFWKRVRRS